MSLNNKLENWEPFFSLFKTFVKPSIEKMQWSKVYCKCPNINSNLEQTLMYCDIINFLDFNENTLLGKIVSFFLSVRLLLSQPKGTLPFVFDQTSTLLRNSLNF